VADSNPEKRQDHGERPSESTISERRQADQHIKDKGGQSTWRASQQAHILEQDESATDLFYKPGEAKQAAQKFELIDSSKSRGEAEIPTAEPITSDNFKNREISAALDNGSSHNPDIHGALQGKIEYHQDAQAPPSFKNDWDGWSQAGRMIASLPFDKQIQVLSAGLVAGVEQYRQEDQERRIGAIIGSVQGVGNVAVNLAKIADFSAYCVIGDKERAGAMAEEFGKAIGETTFSGIRLIELSKRYSSEVSSQGDYIKPFRDLIAVGEMLDSRWSQLPPREQERCKYEIMSQMLADGLVGSVGAQAIGKAKTFTEVLDTVAEQSAKHGLKGIEEANKAVSAVARSIDRLIEPELALPGGGSIKAPMDVRRPQESFIQMMEGSHEGSGPLFGYRGDHDIYSRVNEKGRPKSFLTEEGSLSPANPEGLYKGRKVTLAEHLNGRWCKGQKANSPYTSFGLDKGHLVAKYGDNCVELNLAGLEAEIAQGKQPVTAIHRLDAIIKSVEDEATFPAPVKQYLIDCARKDNEIMVEGVIPKRFIRVMTND
jgi:hypothetical protein